MNEVQQRCKSAVESIIENESLTADLDDPAAKVLLDWGITLSQQIASQTIGMDQSQAEEYMYPPMRALRKMLRAANKWGFDPQEIYLERILKQASLVFGSGFVQPDNDQQYTFTNNLPTGQSDRLIALMGFVKRP